VSAGDGTTTASVLARELIKYGLQSVTAGRNPVALKRGMDKACAALVKILDERAVPVSGPSDITAVAAISAGNDLEIGQMIADAIAKVGPDGVLSIESSNGLETTVEVEEGLEIDRGYISPQFVNNQERSLVELDNVRVLVTDQKLTSIKQIIPLLEKVTQANCPLLIIAEDVTGEALATLVVNKLRGVLNVVAIKAPGFGERRKALLQDIAIITGGEYIATDLGLSVETAELESLGSARRIVVANNKTTLIADAGSKEDIQARVAQIKRELEGSDSIYDQQKLSERIAKLSGGVAIIKVGASTETELEDRKLRIEDAKNATFAAVEEGIVPGGGAAFAHLAVEVQAIADAMADPEEQLGALILQKAIVAPCRLISFNSGREGDVIVQKTQDAEWRMGYNAMTDTFEDLMAAGVIDPKKVTRSALQNAVSVAGMVLTTQAIVTEVPKKAMAAAAAGAGPADQDGMMSI